jgi:hypothetical protein
VSETGHGGRRYQRGPARTLLALCQALLPARRDVPQAAERVTATLLGQTSFMSPLMRVSFRLGLRLLEWSPLVLLRAPRRLSRLDPGQRRALFERWMHSRLYLRRQVALAYNGPIFLCWYDLPEVRDALQYGVQPFVTRLCERHESLLEDDRVHGRHAPRECSMIKL